MKKFLLGAAAAVAIAAPGIASADTNAVIGMNYGNTEFDGGFNINSWGLSGAFSHDMNSGAVLQMDGKWSRSDLGGSGPELGSSYGAVHYGMRNDSHAFAGFVGLTDWFALSGAGVGVEGQMFLGAINLNGSLGFVSFDDALDATHAQIDAAYFVTPNFAITGLVSMDEAEFDGGGDADWTTFGVGGEYRFNGSPFSITGGYRTADFDGDEADTWAIGFNFDLGTDSVQERTRSGPGFNGAEAMFTGLGALTP